MTSDGDGKAKILVVDDSPVMRGAAVKMLGRDFNLVFAEDGAQAWEAITTDRSLQVVFTDLNMPVLDGYALLERIRTAADEGIRNLPVIVVTGAENDAQARERALAVGATDFITKPFDATELRARALIHSEYQRHQRGALVLSDPLTGALAQDGLTLQLDKDLSFCRRHDFPLGLIVVDVVGYNDLFVKAGRRGADTVLTHVASSLRQLIRREDSCARIGLARFLLLLPNSDEAGSALLVGRIDAECANLRFNLRGENVAVAAQARALAPSPLTLAAEQLLADILGRGEGVREIVARHPSERDEGGSADLDPLSTLALANGKVPGVATSGVATPGVATHGAALDAAALAELGARISALLAPLGPVQRRIVLEQIER